MSQVDKLMFRSRMGVSQAIEITKLAVVESTAPMASAERIFRQLYQVGINAHNIMKVVPLPLSSPYA